MTGYELSQSCNISDFQVSQNLKNLGTPQCSGLPCFDNFSKIANFGPKALIDELSTGYVLKSYNIWYQTDITQSGDLRRFLTEVSRGYTGSVNTPIVSLLAFLRHRMFCCPKLASTDRAIG